ncbi:MAG: TetR/AcrR family transcriptional regulator [Verrucomicrobiota bacterium]
MNWPSWMPGGRPKQFREDDILEKAMCLFWERGYHDVSVRDIEKATRTKSQSLYNHFGDKEGIFVGSIEHYIKSRLNGLIETAAAESDPRVAVTLVIEHFRNSAKKSKLAGCFLANAIVDLGSNPEVKKLFDEGFGALTELLKQRLQELPNFTPDLAESRAISITNSIIGLAVSSRSQPTPAQVESVFRGIMELTE